MRSDGFELQDRQGEGDGGDDLGELGNGEEDVMQECRAATGELRVKQSTRQARDGRMRGSRNRCDRLDGRREGVGIRGV